METFKIEIQGFYLKIIEVDAADKEEAILKVKKCIKKKKLFWIVKMLCITEIEEYQE
jgi:hypothetical protein